MTEGDDTTNYRQRHPFAFFGKPLQRLAMRGNVSRRLTTSNSPSVRRAHHNALKHGLAANQGLLAALKGGQQLHRHKETPPCSPKTHTLLDALSVSETQSTSVPQASSFRMAEEPGK